MIYKKTQNYLHLLRLLFDPEDSSNKLTFPMMCRFIRERVNATQSEMAKKLGAGLSSYQHWEYEKAQPSSRAAANLTLMYLQCLINEKPVSKADPIFDLLLTENLVLPSEEPSLKKSLQDLKLLFSEENKSSETTFSSMCCLIRETINISQSNMAKKLGVAFPTYRQWEYGIAEPSSKAAANLTLMYLQCLYIKKQTPSVTGITSLLDALLSNSLEQICA